jgi:preprotein translocase subunit SecA
MASTAADRNGKIWRNDHLDGETVMARIRFARRAADPAQGETGRPSGEAAVLAFCLGMTREVSSLEEAARACTDDDLRARTGAYRDRLNGGEALQALLPEAFATVREAARRTIGLRHHDVQIMGGAALQLGMIAEMRTGEGKTLTATLPAYVAALSGQPVHVMTANDYLARRDRNWMQPVYELLGLTAGLLEPAPKADIPARRAQYAADVTYGPWKEFCHDFLRDNLAWTDADISQRGLGAAIVDEADLILIDEMRTPAMLSGPAAKQEKRHGMVARAARALRPGVHFTTDQAARTATLTEAGLTAIEDWLGIDDLYDPAHGGLAHLVQNAVLALAFQRDRDYLVSGDNVLIIDQKSGRPVHSRYADGFHEALEAKEGVPVQPMQQTMATVTCRDYLRQYQQLTGMTGTAVSEAPIYRDLYGLHVVAIPTNRPVIRIDHPDMLFRTRQAKLAALAADAGRRAAAGQPVLIGAMSAADAEAVAALLTEAGTDSEVLAARNFEREAEVLARAGRAGAVTIVVKMAGRGVDIALGGSAAGHEAVADKGGLCVLGTERTGDRRTELHLRGRAGRQGDPGESLFYLSTEDEVVAGMVRAVPKGLLVDGVPFGMISKQLDKAQFNFAASQAQWYLTNVALDDVLAAQQRSFYADRRSILHEQDMRTRISALLKDVITAEVKRALAAGSGPDALVGEVARLCPVAGARADIASAMQGGTRDREPGVVSAVLRAAQQAYEKREAQVGERQMRELERHVLLGVSDRAWREHLAAMTDLVSGLMIRAAKGTQALAEYQRDAAALLAAMTEEISRDVVRYIFTIGIEAQGKQS